MEVSIVHPNENLLEIDAMCNTLNVAAFPVIFDPSEGPPTKNSRHTTD